MRRFTLFAAAAAILSVGAVLPSSAEAGCYRLGETGYHWYPYWLYPHHRVCRYGYCWYD